MGYQSVADKPNSFPASILILCLDITPRIAWEIIHDVKDQT